MVYYNDIFDAQSVNSFADYAGYKLTSTSSLPSRSSNKRKKKKKTNGQSFGDRINNVQDNLDNVQDNLDKTVEGVISVTSTVKGISDDVDVVKCRVDKLDNDIVRHDVEINDILTKITKTEQDIYNVQGKIMINPNGDLANDVGTHLATEEYVDNCIANIERQQKRTKKLAKLAILSKLL
jgi:predicted  nucleic acid-binding Zn-ribbon protein